MLLVLLPAYNEEQSLPVLLPKIKTAMEEAGFIEAVGSRGNAALYVHCAQEGHHHHVVCTSCGAVADAECSVPTVATNGFAITGHELSLWGLCPRCQP